MLLNTKRCCKEKQDTHKAAIMNVATKPPASLQVAPKLLQIPARTADVLSIAAKPTRLQFTVQPTEAPRVAAKHPSQQSTSQAVPTSQQAVSKAILRV